MRNQKGKAIWNWILIFGMLVQSFAFMPQRVYAAESGGVVINPVDYGADPTGKTDSAEAIWAAFEAAKEATEAGADHVTVDFPKGEYHIYKDRAQQREYHTSNTNSIENPVKWIGLLIEDQENFTMQGNGSLFLMHGNMMALAVVRSENVTLENFSWDFSVPTISEMTVEETGTTEDGKEYTDYLIPECFVHEVDAEAKTIIWNSEKSPYDGTYYWTQRGIHNPSYGIGAYQPEGEMARSYYTNDGPFTNVSDIEEIDDTHVRIVYHSKTGGMREMQKKGAVIQLAANAHRQTAGAFTWESENVTADHVNVHYMHGFGWLVQMSRDVYYKNCNLTPREGSGHRVVSFADGIHASGAAGEIVIENCNFSDTHDDPINLHGTFTRVEQRKDDHTLVLKYIHGQQGGFPQYHVGDQVAFFTRDTLESTDGETLYTVAEVISNPGEKGNDLRTMEVRFEEALPSGLSDKIGNEPKYVAENVTYAPEVTIRNCTFQNVPTRGILCTTRNKVLIEGNTFRGMTMATIYLSNDSNTWYESGPIRDMTIRNNIFYIKTIGRTSWEYAPAIYVNPITKGGQLPSEENPIHKNITIEGNLFYMDADTVVKAESVENLTIRNNTVLRMHPDISLEIAADKTTLQAGDKLTLQTTANGSVRTKDTENVYEFTRCKNVRLEGNVYDDGLKRYAVLNGMSEENLINLDADIQTAHDRSQPASAPVKNIVYMSDNPEVVSVDHYGKMTAKKSGTARVYACYSWNGETIRSNPAEITVVDSIAPDDVVTIQGDEEIVLTEAGEAYSFTAETASGKSVEWAVEDFLTGGSTEAAVIDSSGRLVAQKNGIVWVRADAGIATARKAVVISIPQTEEWNPAVEIRREDKEHYAVTGNAVSVVTQRGDLYQNQNTVKNLFLYQIPDAISKDNVKTVIKIENLPVRESGKYDTASFLLYKDDDHYISCGKKSHYDGIAVVEEANGAATETGGSAEQNTLSCAYFGFYKNGSNVSVDFKEEGGEWQHVKDVSASLLSDDFKIGFTAWSSGNEGKEVQFSEFRAGSGDLSYEALCSQPAISFMETDRHAPEAYDAQWEKESYVQEEQGHVTYQFRDADGDEEGTTLYRFSYGVGADEVVSDASFQFPRPGMVTCYIYPVDAKGRPGAGICTKAVEVKAPEIPEEPKPEEPKPENPLPEDTNHGQDAGTGAPPASVKTFAVGSVIEQAGLRYRVTGDHAVAVVKQVGRKQAKMIIPAKIEQEGVSFSVTAIDKNAFRKNKKLKRVVIGGEIKSIGKAAFFQCSNLKKIQFQCKTPPSIGKKALRGISSACKITYPGKLSAKKRKQWKKNVQSAR